MLCEIEFSVVSYLGEDMDTSRLNVGLLQSNHHLQMAPSEIDTDARI